MKYCNECKINVKDNTLLCPLCSNELEKINNETEKQVYPTLIITSASYTLLKKILLLLSVLTSVISVILNLLFDRERLWSAIIVAAILYSWLAVSNLLRKNTNAAFKIFVQVITTSLLVVIADLQTGYRGWSVNYVLPIIFILGTIVVFIVILFDRTDWAKYVIYQCLIALFGFIPFILYYTAISTSFILSLISCLVSLTSLLTTIILGDKSIKNEFKRRLHF